MGRSKLLLPWGTTTVIEYLLARLLDADVASISILIRQDDVPLVGQLESFRVAESTERSSRLHVMSAQHPPAEMRDSVLLLLREIDTKFSPADTDAWMLVPADSVAVELATLSALLKRWQSGGQDILIPTHAGRRGHPAIFSWSLASRIDDIPPAHGVNWLCVQPDFHIQEFPVGDPALLADLDTPEDYERWRAANDQ